MIGIYKITSPSGRIYIGQSLDIEKRFRHYKYMKCKKQVRLYASFVKYGVDKHIFEIVFECDASELNNKEREFQDFYNVTSDKGLNCDLVSSFNAPKKRSEYTKSKISEASRGNKNWLGKNHSEESKILMSKIQIARNVKMSDAQKLHLSNINKGKRASEETKKILRERSAKAKVVLNTENGIFHYSVREVSETYGLKQNTLITKLSGHRINNTKFIYI